MITAASSKGRSEDQVQQYLTQLASTMERRLARGEKRGVSIKGLGRSLRLYVFISIRAVERIPVGHTTEVLLNFPPVDICSQTSNTISSRVELIWTLF